VFQNKKFGAFKMGCTCSLDAPVQGEEEIVGGFGRTIEQVKLEEVPEERKDMVALEVAASRRTVYRKKLRKFKPSGDLDYNAHYSFLHLRNILDEPVGRFYLREFASKKEFPEMRLLVDSWATMHKLQAPKEVTLESVLEQAKEEDRAKDAAKEGLDPSVHGNLKGVDLFHTRELRTNSEIMQVAKDILRVYIAPGSPNYLGNLLGNDVCERTASTAQEAIKKNDFKQLRGPAFLEIQNNMFLKILDDGYHQKFKEHSEYKRYKMKFSRVYNTVTHRDFDFMRVLGKGSFGRVIRVRKKTTGAQFALKIMSKKKILSGAENEEQVLIERNVLVMCDSASIVKPEFSFQTSRALFLSLELLPGGTLSEAMKAKGGTMTEDETRFLAVQIALGLEHMHKHGIIYRDLKPGNVMLDAKGNAVLTDMGLCAKIRESQFPKEEGGLSSSGHRLLRRKSLVIVSPQKLKSVGTFGYRAPELLSASDERKGYSFEVDWWAFGVTIFFLMYARLPFVKNARKSLHIGLNPKQQEKKLQADLYFDLDMSEESKSLIMALLERDPQKRLGTNPDELRQHPFFKSIDFEKASKREMEPVYKPKAPEYPPDEKPQFEGLADAMFQFAHDNVLELFGGENDMQDEYTHVGRKGQKLFRDWNYLPDELLEADWQQTGEYELFD